MPTKILKFSVVVFLLIILAGLIYLFLPEMESLVGLGSGDRQPVVDMRGENITFNAGNRSASIPPKFSPNILDNLKKNLYQTGGLPLKIERKGNPLPFGIP